MFLFLVDGNRDLEYPSDSTQAGPFRGFLLRNSCITVISASEIRSCSRPPAVC